MTVFDICSYCQDWYFLQCSQKSLSWMSFCHCRHFLVGTDLQCDVNHLCPFVSSWIYESFPFLSCMWFHSMVFEVRFVLQVVSCHFLLQQDLYVYLSESEKFNDFNNPEALVWSEKGMVYGDWSSGSNGDGTRVHSIEFQTSEVISVIILSTVYPEFLIIICWIILTVSYTL